MELGFDLFVRGPKGVTLTAPRRSFLEGAKKTLEAAVSSVELARSVAEREANVLRIGFCSYAMKLGLSNAIASFRVHYPEVQSYLMIFRLRSSYCESSEADWMWPFVAYLCFVLRSGP